MRKLEEPGKRAKYAHNHNNYELNSCRAAQHQGQESLDLNRDGQKIMLLFSLTQIKCMHWNVALELARPRDDNASPN